MSPLDFIRTPKVDNVKLVDYASSVKGVVGTLHLTTTHLIFIDPNGSKETWILYSHIADVERLPITARGSSIRVKTKTFRNVTFIITRERECIDVFDTIVNLSNPVSVEDLFAFHYNPKEDEVQQSSGWGVYDAQVEFTRMEVPSELWVQTKLNHEYKLCETYPKVLYVPESVTKEIVLASAQFRSKGRLPALSYYCKDSQTSICRCAQPMAGFNKRCSEDEQLLQAIINSTPETNRMYIVDTRPKINAMANRAAGKGYENVAHYDNVDFHFIGIENIHVMRQSLQKLIEVFDSQELSMSSYLRGLEDSAWLKHIKAVMDTSLFIVKAVHFEKRSVLVHCSDGWDRTAQTCSLSEMMLDPYYRTIHGFQVLVEKEWLSFGHKFLHRCGLLSGDSKEISPIFTQFLESTWHLMNQFPTAFQFNERFLLEIHDHLYSCQFGTFLGNCERERELNKSSQPFTARYMQRSLGKRVLHKTLTSKYSVSSRTYSLWGYMWQNLPDYVNPFYKDGEHGVLQPSTAPQQFSLLEILDLTFCGVPQKKGCNLKTLTPKFRFWRSLYNRYANDVHARESVADYVCSLNDHNDSLKDHIRYLEKRIEAFGKLKNENKEDINSVKETSTTNNINDVTSEEKNAGDEIDSNKIDDLSEGLETIKLKDDMDKNNEIKENSLHNENISTEDVIVQNVNKTETTNILRKTESIPDLTKEIPSFAVEWDSFRHINQCSCGKPMDALSRKYHCWNCGKVFCARCVDRLSQLPGHYSGNKVPVCKPCFKLLKR